MKHKKLTKAIATRLIAENIAPRLKIEGGEMAPGVYGYEAAMGAFDIVCEASCHRHAGLFELRMRERDGAGIVCMLFHPDTLERDYVAERSEREDAEQETRMEWVGAKGPVYCHKWIDRMAEANQ